MRFAPRPGVTSALAPAVLIILLAPGSVRAGDPVPAWGGWLAPMFGSVASERPGAAQDARAAGPSDEEQARPCPGCPPRRPLRALGEVAAINLVCQGVNLLVRPADAKIEFLTSPTTWWRNISSGFEWDDNTFLVNQFGHPYQGSAYFTAGRSNGLGFWTSASLTALGSLGWEYFHERHPPSLNDLAMTTMGGIALGEMLHRAAWLIREPTDTGRGRLTREILAAVVDPVTGINRFISGESGTAAEKPVEYVPENLVAAFDAGVLWRGRDGSFLDASGEPFLQVNLGYGTLSHGRSRKPFDAFVVDMRFGGGGGLISEAHVRGRLAGRTFSVHPGGRDRHSRHVMAVMGYDYANNVAYQFSGQDVAASVTEQWQFSPDWRLAVDASGGFLVLGAIDSAYQGGPDRNYDFGSGISYGAGVTLTRRGLPFLRVHYAGAWLHTLDGAGIDHWARNLRLDFILPVKGRSGVGTTAEFVRRTSYYDGVGDVRQRYPQLRMYLSWMR